MVCKAKIAVSLITLYQQYVRGWQPSCCRFVPTCSDYAKQAFCQHGFFKGGLMALIRIVHCHPFSGRSGFDPVP